MSVEEGHQRKDHGTDQTRVERMRTWYLRNYCSEPQVQSLIKLQNCCMAQVPFLDRYFGVWSEMGDAPFYTLFIPLFFWINLRKEALALTFFMSLNNLVTQYFKDIFHCPRPPSPPLRHGGNHKHSFEYGFPSTHAAFTFCLIWQIYQTFEDLYPKERQYYVPILLFCLCNILYCRLYQGMHWIGDLIGGFLCFAALAVMEAMFMRDWVFALYDATSIPYWVPFAVAHYVIVFAPVPIDACPCFEDGARFASTTAAAIFGCWVLRDQHLPEPNIVRDEVWWYLCSWTFLKRYIFGALILLPMKLGASAIAPKVMKPIHIFFCGVYLDSIPKPLQPIYTFVCCVWGIALGKKIQRNGDFSLDFTSPHFNSSGLLVDATPGGTDTARRHHRNQLWSVRTHTFWFEWDIHAKYASYYAGTFAVVCIVPWLLSYIDHRSSAL